MLDHAIASLNTSSFFIGMMMLLLNIGSRYIVHELSGNDEEYRRNVLLRRISVFAVCFVGTRDFVISLILTGAFVVLSSGLFRGHPEGFVDKGVAERGIAVGIAGM